MEKKTLAELNLMDDFLFEEAIRRGEKGERFAKILLETILDREFRRVRVIAQKNVRGISPQMHGIRLDAYIEAEENDGLSDVMVEPTIYDIEPSLYRAVSEPKRARYYHSLIDSKLLKSGLDYENLRNVVIIMILPYDPFGDNRMVYTIKSKCEENPEMEYDDGNTTIYLYTRGKEGNDRKALHDMLQYLERSKRENAVNGPLQEIQKLIEEIREDEEIGVSYMKWWEREAYFRNEGKIEGKVEGKILQLIEQVCKKLQKGKNTEQIAEELEADEKEVRKISEAAKELAPEYDPEKILERLEKLNQI